MKIKHIATGLMAASMLIVGSVTAFAATDGNENASDALSIKATTASTPAKSIENGTDMIALYPTDTNGDKEAGKLTASDASAQPASKAQAAAKVTDAARSEANSAEEGKDAETVAAIKTQPAETAQSVK